MLCERVTPKLGIFSKDSFWRLGVNLLRIHSKNTTLIGRIFLWFLMAHSQDFKQPFSRAKSHMLPELRILSLVTSDVPKMYNDVVIAPGKERSNAVHDACCIAHRPHKINPTVDVEHPFLTHQQWTMFAG
jgi:hypothetical protein